MAESCSTCKFSAPGTEKVPGTLECRRNPPVDLGRRPAAEWPRVFPDGWCGEYQAKAATPRKRPAAGERETREQG